MCIDYFVYESLRPCSFDCGKAACIVPILDFRRGCTFGESNYFARIIFTLRKIPSTRSFLYRGEAEATTVRQEEHANYLKASQDFKVSAGNALDID